MKWKIRNYALFSDQAFLFFSLAQDSQFSSITTNPEINLECVAIQTTHWWPPVIRWQGALALHISLSTHGLGRVLCSLPLVGHGGTRCAAGDNVTCLLEQQCGMKGPSYLQGSFCRDDTLPPVLCMLSAFGGLSRIEMNNTPPH